MKFVFVIPSWSYRGGEKIFIKLAGALKSEGHDVALIFGRKEHSAIKIDFEAKVYYPVQFNKLLLNNLFFFFFSWILIVPKIIKASQDVDYIISESNSCLTASVLVSLVTGKKVIWYVMAYEERHYKNSILNFLWDLTFGFMERQEILRVKNVFALSSSVNRILGRRFKGMTSVVLNPVIDTAIRPNLTTVNSKLKNFFATRKVIFLPAALHYKKNQKLALQVIADLTPKYGNLGLVLAGAGGDLDYLLALTRKLKITDNVYFAGILDKNDMAFCYTNSILTLVCSISDNEGLSLTSLESLSYATPIIVSKKAGVAQIISENKVGIVVKPTPPEFRSAIVSCVNNPKPFRGMAEQGKTWVKNEFSQTKVARLMLLNLKMSH
jgi:glycosyltransferase involved in cell wall biosynthesis